MKIAKALITISMITISSAAFAGSKCSHMMNSQGNSLLQHTAAPSVSTQGTQAPAAATQQAVK